MGKKYGLKNMYFNYDLIFMYDEIGEKNYIYFFDEWVDMYDIVEDDVGRIFIENFQDMNICVGFSLVGWKFKKNMYVQVVEWWSWDWEILYFLEVSSFEFGIVGLNFIFN